MKNLSVILLISLFGIVPLCAQQSFTSSFSTKIVLNTSVYQNTPNNLELNAWDGKGDRLRNAGRGLTFAGIPVLATGIGFLIASQKHRYYNTWQTEAGQIISMVGGGMVIPGALFWFRGNRINNPSERSQRIRTGKGKRNAGAVMTAVGLAAVVSGISLAAASDGVLICGDGRLGGGIAFMLFGHGLGIPGAILLGKGNQKYKKFKGVSLQSSGTSLGLVYTF